MVPERYRQTDGRTDRQVAAFFNQNKLFPSLQSAYRPRHSTETALIKIMNDALLAADQGMVTLVVLLDYSAAFDPAELRQHDICLTDFRRLLKKFLFAETWRIVTSLFYWRRV